MKLERLYIDSFRGLRTVDLQNLDPHVNLFVGVNGAGKSSILDAISLLMSWYIARIQNVKGRGWCCVCCERWTPDTRKDIW